MEANEIPEIGKISSGIFNELIFIRLGAKSEQVLVGPQHGVDVGIVEIGDKAVSFTCDPVFIVPEYGWGKAAWFAIHILNITLIGFARGKRMNVYTNDWRIVTDGKQE